jgi:hypothetical protein
MSKKKLDELFQDKFLGFKEVPDDRVWASIEASLNKKKKKRILPLWWSLGGIAAALVVGLLIFNPFNQEGNTDQNITDIEQKETDTIKTSDDATKELDLNSHSEDSIEFATDTESHSVSEQPEVQVATTTDSKDDSLKGSRNQGQKNKTIPGVKWSKENEAIVHSPQTSKDKREKYKDINKANLKSEIDVADTKEAVQQSSEKSLPAQNLKGNKKIVKDSNETAVATNNSDSKQNKAVENELPNANITGQIGSEKTETQVALNEKEQKRDSILSTNKKSIFDEIEIQKVEAIAETPTKKWSAGPSVAPVYFNAIGEGSSVHSIFVPNAKSGNINMSYGVSVGYELSSKLSVRTGIHKVDFGYDTNDIAFSSSPLATTNGQIDNINYRATSKNLVVSSKPGGSAREQAPTNSIDFSSSQNIEREGFMTQQMGYLEIPLELNYALLDNKFGLNVIGGVSSLFLVDNSVALTSGNLTTEMGEANNVNDLNFSANFGLGVNYKFSRNIHLNIEPVFKYQLNTFSETDGTFNPYTVGVYSGLSFRF